MARKAVIDIIQSDNGSSTKIDNLLEYSQHYDLSELTDEQLVTAYMLRVLGFSVPAPKIIEMTVGQSVPYSFSLPSNFQGKYQVNCKIDRGGGIWEDYPNILVQDLLDESVLPDYFVNRVDIYGTPAGDGTNLDHLLFTFSKA